MINSQGISFLFENGFLFEVISATLPGASRESIDVSHLFTKQAMEFIAAALVDYGELNVTMGFNPRVTPPILEEKSAASIVFKDATTWTFDAFLTNYVPTAETNDKMTATATIKVSGKIDVNPNDSSSSGC